MLNSPVATVLASIACVALGVCLVAIVLSFQRRRRK